VPVCPFCDEELGGSGSGVAEAVVEGTLADAAAGEIPRVPAGAYRRFRHGTIIWASCLLLGIAMIAAGATGRDLLIFTILGWILGIVCSVGTLVTGIADLTLLPPERLTTPEAAFRTFLKCVKEKRWEYAWALVVPRAREASRRRGAIPEIKVEAGHFPMSTLEGFKGYWSGLILSSAGYNRTAKFTGVRVARSGNDRAVGEARIEIGGYPSWVLVFILVNIIVLLIVYLIVRKSAGVRASLEMVRVGDRWFLANPVPRVEK
jgi:hypothetical protein